MQIDPVLEWQRLTEEYRQKGEGELLELARDYADLTEPAQQALRAEMRSRGLRDPAAPEAAPRSYVRPERAVARVEPEPVPENSAFPLGGLGAMPELVPSAPETAGRDADEPHEYTWKTPLCDCYSREEAAQLQEALRRAGIESWFNFGGYTTSFVPMTSQSVMFGDIQVLVAADQLDQARAIVAQPIPQQIIDASKVEEPEYVVPKCPKCGAEDPILESVEPANTWRCEQCDEQWTETLPAAAGDGPGA